MSPRLPQVPHPFERPAATQAQELCAKQLDVEPRDRLPTLLYTRDLG
jgi:hypothetical protein